MIYINIVILLFLVVANLFFLLEESDTREKEQIKKKKIVHIISAVGLGLSVSGANVFSGQEILERPSEYFFLIFMFVFLAFLAYLAQPG
ncbi:hypothetical protein Kkor_2049 [Kangiella koreensis DSM 16069]|uniref:Uncharacterized protein n=2 Tax=Kangiella TaxID=261963 RepID=C7R703_KANKD|nr:hypothetical protein Kkor_2049 [Kangiella koreensis DSM 16069]